MDGPSPEYFQVQDQSFQWAEIKTIDITGFTLRVFKHDDSIVAVRFISAEELVKTVKRLMKERKAGVHFSLGQF